MVEEGLRECDDCGRVTDAGEWPDWINGSCEQCDPEILDHPENIERVSPMQLERAKDAVSHLRSRRN